jgi:predicted dehydrogenase
MTAVRPRIGVVGTGHWARVVHAAGAAAHPGVDFVAVWGRDLSRASGVADQYAARAFDDLEAFLAEVDLVTVAVPPHVQAELALRAAGAGKHLLLEKPVALDPDAADKLVDIVEERALSTVVFFTQRFVPTWEDWLQQVVATAPEGGRADWLTSREPGSPYLGSVWRDEHGALWDVGPHTLSQLLPALGAVVDVTGARGQRDLVHLVLTHEGGRTSRMSLSLTMPGGIDQVEVEFYGRDGVLVQPAAERDVADAYARALDELLAMVGAGETHHRCGVRFGRDVVHVLARCQTVLDAKP